MSKQRLLKILIGDSGFSLMEVMIAAGMMGVVSLGVLSINSLGLKGGSNNLITFQADSVRKRLASLINNDQSWAQTVGDAANTSLACIKNTTDCRGATGPFRIRNAKGDIEYDPLVATDGFTANGVRCTTYTAAGSDACPFRFDYTWTAVCPTSGPCLNPQVSISGQTLFKPSPTNKFRQFALNPVAYGLNMVRNATATAQGNGSGYYLARWSDNKTLSTSQVFESSAGQLGFNTTNPTAKIDLNGLPVWSNFRLADGNQGIGKYLTSNADGSATWSLVDRATAANSVFNDSYDMRFHYNGQGGQPSWLWGTNNGADSYVWNPSNFNVASAVNATNATYVNNDAANMKFHYAEQGQLQWLWMSNEPSNAWVVRPGNIKVGSSNWADGAGWANSCGTCTTLAGGSNGADYLKVFNTSANYARIGYLGADAQFGLFVDGQFIKSFVINHPTDPARYLIHGTLEGPEGGVYYRGRAELKNGHALVKLPSYFEALTRKEDRTVHLTGVGGFDAMAVKTGPAGEVHDGYFEVISTNQNSRQAFFWEVVAVRADVDRLVVEPLKAEYEVHGVGPYSYAQKRKGKGQDALERSVTGASDEIRELREALCELNPRAKACSK